MVLFYQQLTEDYFIIENYCLDSQQGIMLHEGSGSSDPKEL